MIMIILLLMIIMIKIMKITLVKKQMITKIIMIISEPAYP